MRFAFRSKMVEMLARSIYAISSCCCSCSSQRWFFLFFIFLKKIMKFVSMNLIFSNFSENVSGICSPRMRREAVRERRRKKMQLRFFFLRSENKKKWLIKEIAFLDGFFVLRWNEKFLWILFVTPFRSFLDFDFDNFLCIWYEYEYELVYGLCYLS
jgi:hypothetical protein